MLHRVRLLLCLMLVGLVQVSHGQSLTLPQPRFANDLSHQYHVRLLQMALEQSATDDKPAEFTFELEMSEGRASVELAKGSLIDVYWLGANVERSQKLRAIPIPTTRGLIGFRQFIIKAAAKAEFDRIGKLSDLSKFVACQGTSWPDVDILRSAGLQVTTTPVLENLYRMLDAGRCDYFPRGLHDIAQELGTRQPTYPELVGYDNILLHYPFAVYFFTNRQNEALAMRIEQGLQALVDKGLLVKHMQTSPLTRHIFPLPTNNQALFINIPNPSMQIDPRYSDQRFWFVPGDFGLDLNH